MAVKGSDGNLKTYTAEECNFQKHLNTNWPRKEESIDNIPDKMPGPIGPQFVLEEIQKTVRAMKSRKCLVQIV